MVSPLCTFAFSFRVGAPQVASTASRLTPQGRTNLGTRELARAHPAVSRAQSFPIAVGLRSNWPEMWIDTVMHIRNA